jgi:hypothetical protein
MRDETIIKDYLKAFGMEPVIKSKEWLEEKELLNPKNRVRQTVRHCDPLDLPSRGHCKADRLFQRQQPQPMANPHELCPAVGKCRSAALPGLLRACHS